MAEDKVYAMDLNRLSQADYDNMKIFNTDGIARIRPDKAGHVLLPVLDSGRPDSTWGRLRFDVRHDKNVIYRVSVFASNENIFSQQLQPLIHINHQDILLYELTGRYLWILIEAEGVGSFYCEHICIYAVGDNFMATFPEVYNERNSFFHRYMSIFSSIYNDFSQEINSFPTLLDIDKAPVPLLETYAEWFGIDIKGGFLQEGQIRTFMHEIFYLVKRKGTKETLQRAAEIALGQKPVIIERNLIAKSENSRQEQLLNELYGTSPFDVTVLTFGSTDETKRAKLTYFLEQFTPVRCNLRVIFLRDYGVMDKYTYLGINTKLKDIHEGAMDTYVELDQMTILK